MAQPLQRRRHQEPAQLSRLATRPRSLGRPTRPRSLDQRRHRQRTIPTANAIRAPFFLSFLARAYADVGQFENAWRCIGEAIAAMETTKQTWFEADINRTGAEIALLTPDRDAVKAEAYFERALEIARAHQARSWELRAATSLARLWREQGKRAQAHDLLAPVYGWFTEGFDTLDLKDAKALLQELAS